MVRTASAVIAARLVVAWTPHSASAATCDDYSNQAAAQRAMDTRDADGDGIYRESLPCPCLKPGDSGGGGGGSPTPTPKRRAASTRPQGVQRVVFSRSKPEHQPSLPAAVGKGWPRVTVLNRKGADERRDRLLDGFPTQGGFDRAGYPAALGRGKPNGDLRASCVGSPGGLDGRRGVRPQQREPLARLIARREAPRVLRRHPVPVPLRLR